MFYGHLQRDSEVNLRARIDLIKSRIDFNRTGGVIRPF